MNTAQLQQTDLLATHASRVRGGFSEHKRSTSVQATSAAALVGGIHSPGPTSKSLHSPTAAAGKIVFPEEDWHNRRATRERALLRVRRGRGPPQQGEQLPQPHSRGVQLRRQAGERAPADGPRSAGRQRRGKQRGLRLLRPLCSDTGPRLPRALLTGTRWRGDNALAGGDQSSRHLGIGAATAEASRQSYGRLAALPPRRLHDTCSATRRSDVTTGWPTQAPPPPAVPSFPSREFVLQFGNRSQRGQQRERRGVRHERNIRRFPRPGFSAIRLLCQILWA